MTEPITKAERAELRRFLRDGSERCSGDWHGDACGPGNPCTAHRMAAIERMRTELPRLCDLADQLEAERDDALRVLRMANPAIAWEQVLEQRAHYDALGSDLDELAIANIGLAGSIRLLEQDRDQLREQLALAVRGLGAASLTQLDDIDIEMERAALAQIRGDTGGEAFARSKLESAIRRFTVDTTDGDGNLVPNGPAEEAMEDLGRLMEDPLALKSDVAELLARYCEASATDTQELREAAEGFFGGDFRAEGS